MPDKFTLRDGSARARDGLARARDGSARARDGLARARDGSARARDGLARARDGLARARDGLAHARDGLARALEIWILGKNVSKLFKNPHFLAKSFSETARAWGRCEEDFQMFSCVYLHGFLKNE